ncbi:hypothetical protein PAF15_04850 [Weissella koreensis]|uniref:hypothetical protein n=1 Tax=Weissella koreensis TaxID=165096 RepID=UPI0022BA37D9|nr:hypothetical protein [Weissella koreensis]MCZ9311288.1 hypothetical protein [Weissella koreensis]
MEQTPYLKTEILDERAQFSNALEAKLQYISDVQQAINEDNDRKLFQLLDSKKYSTIIKEQIDVTDNQRDFRMIDDLMEALSHHLSQRLIQYLSERFPFFYYEEDTRGVYQLYFGNWWDRRHFGLLDPITVTFIFDEDEYEMLQKSVELATEGRRYHTNIIEKTTKANEKLQKIVDKQDERDQERDQFQKELEKIGEKPGMFESQENKARREFLKQRLSEIRSMDEKAWEVPKLIAENNDLILNYSKEDTILIYEQRAINDQFGNFENFKVAVKDLYRDYVKQLDDRPLSANGGRIHD